MTGNWCSRSTAPGPEATNTTIPSRMHNGFLWTRSTSRRTSHAEVAISLAVLAVLPITAAHAYIGPGAGAGTIAVVLGILSSIFLSFFLIFLYPIKRLVRKLRSKPSVTGQPRAAGGVTGTDTGAAAVGRRARR